MRSSLPGHYFLNNEEMWVEIKKRSAEAYLTMVRWPLPRLCFLTSGLSVSQENIHMGLEGRGRSCGASEAAAERYPRAWVPAVGAQGSSCTS